MRKAIRIMSTSKGDGDEVMRSSGPEWARFLYQPTAPPVRQVTRSIVDMA
jgi:hypothetical protein